MGGDQLTVSRMQSVNGGLDNSNCPGERLEGLVPVIENWLAKVIFFKGMNFCVTLLTLHLCRSYGQDYINMLARQTELLCTTYGIRFIGRMLEMTQRKKLMHVRIFS